MNKKKCQTSKMTKIAKIMHCNLPEGLANVYKEAQIREEQVKYRMIHLGVTTLEELFAYTEALEQTVIQIGNALANILNKQNAYDVADITGLPLRLCTKTKEMTDSLPIDRGSVKDYVRKITNG